MKKGKTRARANGEGTVYQNANGTWTGQYVAPDKKRHSKTFNTQRMAKSWVREQTQAIEDGNYIEPSNQRLDLWWDQWIEVYRKRSVSKATLDSYYYSKKRIPEHLMQKPLSKITPTEIQALLNDLDDSGSSTRTIEITRTHLQMCFERAVTDRLIKFNPVSGTVLPDDDSCESTPLTEDEEVKLVDYCLKSPSMRADGGTKYQDARIQVYKDALLFILRTGVRRSEALNAEWSDWKGNTVHIRGTKTSESNRMVPLTSDLVEMLKRRQETITSPFIFETTRGTQLGGRNLLRHLQRFNGHKVHSLRHTYCTRAAQVNVNPKILQTITGHKKIETLLQIYTHVNDKDRAEASAKIAGYCKSTANAE